MKYLILLLFLLGNLNSFTQVPGLGQGKTYAVVVGISDYQDPDISDLHFARRDAEAFASFLRSPAGGNLGDDHLKLLVDDQATTGRMISELEWLIENCKEGDQAIIYFSGHGDVEQKTTFNLGFLLSWDSPSNSYAAGAFHLYYLQAIVSTLSIEKKAKVTLITDACRSGNLAGNEIGGSQLTNANLAKQFANETKILSCQANEKSIEGEQWGGGHGAFSYHLLDGLYGLADKNKDLTVSLLELGRYLQDHVTEEALSYNHNQNPIARGNPSEKLAYVDSEELALWQKRKKETVQMFNAVASKGIEEETFVSVDSNTQVLYSAFQEALINKQFLSPDSTCADFYFNKLIIDPDLEQVHSAMRLNYAAALQDEVQQVLNKWLKTDITEIILSKKTQQAKYQYYPLYLERAAELLGKQHYMYPVLQARKLFFEGHLTTLGINRPDNNLREQAIEKFRAALSWQTDMPHVYLWMGENFAKMMQLDSAAHYARMATTHAPSWVLPYTNLAFLYSHNYKEFDLARALLEKVNQIDSTSIYVLNVWGNLHFDQQQYPEAESYFLKCIEKDSNFIYAHISLGVIYSNSNRFELAEQHYKKAIQIDSTYAYTYNNLGYIYGLTGRDKEAEHYLKKALLVDSTFAYAYGNLGSFYLKKERNEEAEQVLKNAIRFDSTMIVSYHDLGGLFLNNGRFPEAEECLSKALQIDSTNFGSYSFLGIVYAMTGRFPEAELQFKKIIQLDSTHIDAYYNLTCLYSLQNQMDNAFEHLEIGLINGIDYYKWLQEDTSLIGMREHKERRQTLMQKYFPEEFKN